MTRRRKRNLIGVALATLAVALGAAFVRVSASILPAPAPSGDTASAISAPGAGAVATTAAAPGDSVLGSRPLSAAAFRARAAAICERLALPSASELTSLPQPALAMAARAAAMSDAVQRLRAIAPPDGIAAQVRYALKLMQQSVDAGDRLTSAAAARDRGGELRAYERLGGLSARADGMWTVIGVAQC